MKYKKKFFFFVTNLSLKQKIKIKIKLDALFTFLHINMKEFYRNLFYFPFFFLLLSIHYNNFLKFTQPFYSKMISKRCFVRQFTDTNFTFPSLKLFHFVSHSFLSLSVPSLPQSAPLYSIRLLSKKKKERKKDDS